MIQFIWRIALLSVMLACACGCGGFNLFDTGPVYYTVTAIHTDPAEIHAGDVVTLTQTHSGSYDGLTLGMYMPTTHWAVDKGYFLDTTWSERDGPLPPPGFDPHVAKQQVIDMTDPPHWLAPAEPGIAEITCLYTNQAPSMYCVPLTVEVEVLPAQ